MPRNDARGNAEATHVWLGSHVLQVLDYVEVASCLAMNCVQKQIILANEVVFFFCCYGKGLLQKFISYCY